MPPLWEQWINQGERITARALKVFLSDAKSASGTSNQKPRRLAMGRNPASRFRIPTPTSQQRQEALAAVQNSVNALYGGDAADGAAGVNLVHYQARAAMSLAARNAKKAELEAFVAGSAERAEQREQVRRSVRMHTLAAGIVGNALSRGVLGDEAPQVRTLAGPDALQLVGEDYERAKQVLDKFALGACSCGGNERSGCTSPRGTLCHRTVGVGNLVFLSSCPKDKEHLPSLSRSATIPCRRKVVCIEDLRSAHVCTQRGRHIATGSQTRSQCSATVQSSKG